MLFYFVDVNYKPIDDILYDSSSSPIPRAGEFVRMYSGKDIALVNVKQINYDYKNNKSTIVLNIDNSKTFKWSVGG